MNRYRAFGIIIMLFVFTQTIFSCAGDPNSENSTQNGVEAKTAPETEAPSPGVAAAPSGLFDAAHFGTYVSDSYDRRAEGYDWVGVRVEPYSEQRVRVIIRSRADQKKPTCTLDVIALIQDAHNLQVYEGEAAIAFRFADNQVTIGAIEGRSDDALYYFCSGGATIAGSYRRIEGAWDASQVDPRAFAKTLTYGDFTFFVEAREGRLTVETVGLELDDRPMVMEIEGEAVHAEVGDLNSDGYPELVVMTATRDADRYGSVAGFTVLSGRSLVMVHMPDLRNDPEAGAGYSGHDEFAIVETTLVRRFPLPGGNTRQIQYKIVPGEALPQFAIDRVVTY